MAVHIRLSREGKPKHAFYRVVAADSRRARNGRYLEVLGTYDPRKTEGGLTWRPDRVKYWLGKGALPTQTVAQLLRRQPLAS